MNETQHGNKTLKGCRAVNFMNFLVDSLLQCYDWHETFYTLLLSRYWKLLSSVWHIRLLLFLHGAQGQCGIITLSFRVYEYSFSHKFNVYRSVHRKYILLYISNKMQRHTGLFISGNCSTCFGWYLHPSSGAHTTVSTASGICRTVTAPSRWRYSPGWALASSTMCLQASRFLALSFHSFKPIFLRSMDTSFSHLVFGLPLRLVAYSFPYKHRYCYLPL